MLLWIRAQKLCCLTMLLLLETRAPMMLLLHMLAISMLLLDMRVLTLLKYMSFCSRALIHSQDS